MKCQRRQLITAEGSGKYKKVHVKPILAACLQQDGNLSCRNVAQTQGIIERDKEKLRKVSVCVTEWTSSWKYRPSHWIFYFLQYERWDSPLCSLLLSLFQVFKVNKLEINEDIFVF